MAMDDIEAMVARVRQEWFANPKHRVLLLLIERNARKNAGVDEEPLVITLGERQAVEPNKVLIRNRACACDPVAAQSHVAAVAKPECLVAILQHADQHLLVIAAEAADLPRFGFLQFHQQLNHLPTVLAAIDIVANEDKSGVAATTMATAVLQQARELVVAAMDVPDGVDQWARHADSVHAWISAIALHQCRVKQFCSPPLLPPSEALCLSPKIPLYCRRDGAYPIRGRPRPIAHQGVKS